MAALEVQELLGKKSFNTLSDAGYSTGDQLSLCKDSGICTYSSPMPSTFPYDNCLPLSSFIYNNEENCYICPSGERMTCGTAWTNRVYYKSKIYKTKACKKCQMREVCTQNKGGRVLERSEFQEIIDENNRRVLDNPDSYKLLKAIIEHPFGILKRQRGFTFTIMRGKKNVMSETYILMIIYNLKRCLSIMGENDFKDKIRSHYSFYLQCNTLFCRQLNYIKHSQYLRINLMRA
ncbi:MAG: transposase [Bacteroidales bacterium]|nr:transposase [Bacteroidales bacterium]